MKVLCVVSKKHTWRKGQENWGKQEVINTAVVISGARGILQSQDQTRLAEFGGPVTLTTAWAKLLLRHMNFTKRQGTTKSKLPVEEFNKLKAPRFCKSMGYCIYNS